jgi:hypothetical protein
MGRVRDANVELSSAVKMLRTMEMTFWLPEAERELAELEAALAGTYPTLPRAAG